MRSGRFLLPLGWLPRPMLILPHPARSERERLFGRSGWARAPLSTPSCLSDSLSAASARFKARPDAPSARLRASSTAPSARFYNARLHSLAGREQDEAATRDRSRNVSPRGGAFPQDGGSACPISRRHTTQSLRTLTRGMLCRGRSSWLPMPQTTMKNINPNPFRHRPEIDGTRRRP